ncbi:MAG TPA: site-specific integrase, partial [Mycobacteriales bacterium]|nr:site-specific integrase [Mycobacteriales bacterium]
PSKVTIGELLDTWLLGARDLKATTRHGYQVHLKPVRARLGNVSVQALAKADVESLVEHMLTTGGRNGKGRAASTVRQALIVLEQAIDDAVRQGILARNVVRLVAKPRLIRHEMRIWTAPQLAAFLETAKADRLSALWRITALGGLRRGEATGLRWVDVDWEASQIRIVQTRVPVGNEIVTDEPKTAAGRRTVDIDPQTLAALRVLRRQQVEERLAAGPGYLETGLIAVDALGAPIDPAAFANRFARLTREAGLPLIRLHDLRHTAASLMHESGEVSLRTIASILGHADPAFTLRTYGHASDEAKKAATATLATLVRM